MRRASRVSVRRWKIWSKGVREVWVFEDEQCLGFRSKVDASAPETLPDLVGYPPCRKRSLIWLENVSLRVVFRIAGAGRSPASSLQSVLLKSSMNLRIALLGKRRFGHTWLCGVLTAWRVMHATGVKKICRERSQLHATGECLAQCFYISMLCLLRNGCLRSHSTLKDLDKISCISV